MRHSCRNALDHFRILEERSRSFSNPFPGQLSIKNKMATLNEHISVLAEIMSDISGYSDTNFIYILLSSECQQRNNEEHFKTNKTPNEITVCSKTN